jgi:Zn finger protein HypA/HybF involved in hydrogenase expression
VEHAAKLELTQVQAEPAQTAVHSAASLQDGQKSVVRTEDPSRYCPVCSQRLEPRRCKLICSVCGYYMSCSDYY